MSMSDERRPHPKNASGPFYVENGCCLRCMAPHGEAPTLMGFNEADGHCFVKRQPQTEESFTELFAPFGHQKFNA